MEYVSYTILDGAAKAENAGNLIKSVLDLCQYFGQKKLKDYDDFLSSSSSFCWGVI